MQLLKHYRRKDISHPGQQSLIRGTLARTLLVPTVLCLFVLLLDLATPRGVAMGIAYIPLILCGLWYTRPHITFVFAAIATSLTIVAVFVKAPSDVAMWMVLLNRFMTICVLWFVAALIYSHRKYEQILKQSEKPFKSLADALPHIVWTATPDGDLDYYNQLWFDYTGMTFEQTKGWGWKPVLHPDDLQNCIDVWTNAIKNGEFFENEYRFKRVSDGTYRWHLGRGTPVRDANGIIVKWFGTCTDIQDQKRSLHDLKESVEQFQLLANSLLQLVWMADETGWIYWYNDRWYEYTGTVAKDMEGWGWQSVHDQEKLPSVMEKWQKSIATSEPFEMVFPLKGTDGVFRQFLTRVTPVKDGTGKTTKWLGTNTDITDQKGAENKALEALRLSEARYDLTVQGMSIGVWDWNVATGELYWSKRFQDMLGINDQEFRPHYEEFVNRLHPDDKEVTEKMLFDHLKNLCSYNVEYRLKHTNGDYIWIHAHGQAQWDENGEPVRMAGSVIDISDRKKTEEERKKLIAIIEESTDYIGVADLQGNLQYHNRSARRMVGLPEDYDLSTIKISEMHPAWASKLVLEQGVPACFEFGSWHGETALLHKDGHEIPVLQNLALHRNGKGEPLCFTTIIRDIRERKREELLLKVSEERLNLATSGTSDGLWDWDLITDKVYYSPRFMYHLGYEVNEMPYTLETFKCLLHPDDIERTFEAVTAAHKRKAPYDIEYRLRHKEGHYIWCHATGQTVWDERDHPVRMTGFLSNIDKRKHSQESLEISESFNRSLMDASGDCIKILDIKGQLMRMNSPGLCIMEIDDFGPLCGKEWWSLWPEVTQSEVKKSVEEATKGNQYRFQAFCPTAKGTPKWWDVQISPVLDTDGTILHLLSVSRDITQREVLIEKLAESNTELERFAYVASHDMQEPLRMIANFGELISEEYGNKLDAEGKEYVHLVTESAIRMQNMVDDLLEYARIGNEGIRLVTINGAEELKHALDNLSASIQEQKANITFDQLPPIKGNAVQFIRLLQNLIGNGLKYQAEGAKPSIHVGVEDQENNLLFSVRDNGIGMPNEYATQVFEPFKRLHTWAEYKGTGIGLAVSKKIVENHGGRIWATSELGKGSTIYFTLPKIKLEEL